MALTVSGLLAGVALAHDELLPDELRGALPTLPTGETPVDVGHAHDHHSANMILVANWRDPDASGSPTYRQGSDLAFWGDYLIAGNYGAPGGLRVVSIADPSRPYEVGQLDCPGSQADVSVWQSLAFVSVDSPRSAPECGAGAASALAQAQSQGYEGIRVISLADPKNPTQVAFVDTDCGSHTHTLYPDPANGRVLIYVLSYPLGVQYPDCSVETHGKISVVEVPLLNPAAARVVSTPDVSPGGQAPIGCHDVTVFVERKLAAAACISESQLWDLQDPVNPRIVSRIVNPEMNIHHSSTFSWDGKTLVLGDELGGAVATPGCADGGDEHLPLGALWFYDVSDPSQPRALSFYRIPQQVADTVFCTAHNFNTVPLKSGQDVLVSAWYNGGTTVVDFSDPTQPTQLGFYIPEEPVRAASWSSYWYNGFIYANNFDEDVNSLTAQSRGIDVFAIADHNLKKASKVKHLNPQTMEPFAGDSKATR